MNKVEARTYFLAQRHAQSNTQLDAANQAVLEQFKRLPLNEVRYLHLFLPIETKKEVNTYLLAQWLKENHPEIILVLSKTNTESHTLSHFIWDKHTVLKTNKWGITEPEGGMEVSEKKIDWVLVPLLAYDLVGNRVGYGKGFYDRFLAECRSDVQKIGLSHFEPIDCIDHAEAFDIKLNACIEPQRIWRFNDFAPSQNR